MAGQASTKKRDLIGGLNIILFAVLAFGISIVISINQYESSIDRDAWVGIFAVLFILPNLFLFIFKSSNFAKAVHLIFLTSISVVSLIMMLSP